MQFLVILLTVPILAISAAVTPRDIVQFAILRQRCGDEFTIDPTALERARAGEIIDDPEFHCYVACVLQGMNIMRPDGTLNANEAIEKVRDSPFHGNLIDAITSCTNQSGENKCDTARRLFACMHEKKVFEMLRS